MSQYYPYYTVSNYLKDRLEQLGIDQMFGVAGNYTAALLDTILADPESPITISGNGDSVLYTPATDFVGSDTFTYTIDDGNGGTNTATVTVQVLDFIPSNISGQVYIDTNNDGIRSRNELMLGGVEINLFGTTQNGESVSRSTRTLGNGSYEFIDLAPGVYTIQQSQPAFLIDGLYSSMGSE